MTFSPTNDAADVAYVSCVGTAAAAATAAPSFIVHSYNINYVPCTVLILFITSCS